MITKDQLKQELDKTIELLNKTIGFTDRVFRKKEFKLEDLGEIEQGQGFIINFHARDFLNEWPYSCNVANIVIKEDFLEGNIDPSNVNRREYNKIKRDIHYLSHKYNVGTGNLLSSDDFVNGYL